MTATFIQVGLRNSQTASSRDGRTYLGWHDPDKKRATVDKLADGIARFREKFGIEPTVVLCNIVDAEELRAAGVEIEIRDVLFLGTRGTFYLGVQ